MVEGMSVVVNVMLSRMSVMSPTDYWNWQFCKDLKIGVTPFPSIGLRRRTTTTTVYIVRTYT